MTDPAPPAPPPEPPPKAAGAPGGTVQVAVGYPHDVFESGVADVERLTREFVQVARSKLPELEKAAKAAAVKLITKEV